MAASKVSPGLLDQRLSSLILSGSSGLRYHSIQRSSSVFKCRPNARRLEEVQCKRSDFEDEVQQFIANSSKFQKNAERFQEKAEKSLAVIKGDLHNVAELQGLMVEKQTRSAVEGEEGSGFAAPLSLKSVDDYAEYFSQVDQDGNEESVRRTKETARRNLTKSLLEQVTIHTHPSHHFRLHGLSRLRESLVYLLVLVSGLCHAFFFQLTE